MPHIDWRARLSVALTPETAQGLNERLAHGFKAGLFRGFAEELCEAAPGSMVLLMARLDDEGRVADWSIQSAGLQQGRAGKKGPG